MLAYHPKQFLGFSLKLSLKPPSSDRIQSSETKYRLDFSLGWLPEFSNQFSIVDFSDEYRSILIQVR